VNLDGFLERTASGDGFGGDGSWAGGWAGVKPQPARCLRKTQNSSKFAIVSWQRSFCTVAYARMHERICIFCGEYACIYRCCEHYACADLYVKKVLRTSAYTFASRSLQDVHIRSCMCGLFHFALRERGWRSSASL